jgi:hypothetical protein
METKRTPGGKDCLQSAVEGRPNVMVLVLSTCSLPSSAPTISDRIETRVKHTFHRDLPDGYIHTIFNQAPATEGSSHLLTPFPAIPASLHALPPVPI